MNKVYTRIEWKNYPSIQTPLNETNLNKMDYAVDVLDNRIIGLDTAKMNTDDIQSNIKDWTMNETTGIITITKYSGEQIIFDLNVEKIPVDFKLSEDGILTMTTADENVFTANIGSMIPVLTFNSSDTINVTVSGEGVNKSYTFTIKEHSIGEDQLQANYLADIKTEQEKATNSATKSENQATLSESWAVGNTGTREGEDTNNAKYYAEQAKSANVIDTEMSETSINPVQNKVITKALGNKQDKLTNPLTKSDVVNNLTTSTTNVPLSAAQGKALNDKLGNKQDKQDSSLTTSAKTVSGAINELVETTNAINQNLDKIEHIQFDSITDSTGDASFPHHYEYANGYVVIGAQVTNANYLCTPFHGSTPNYVHITDLQGNAIVDTSVHIYATLIKGEAFKNV